MASSSSSSVFSDDDETSDSWVDYSSESLVDYSSDSLVDYSSESVKDYTSESVKDYASDSLVDYSSESVKDYASDSLKDYASDLSDILEDGASDTLEDGASDLADILEDGASDSLEDGASDTTDNEDYQQVRNQNPDNRKRKISSWTDPGSMGRDAKRRCGDYAGHGERDKHRSDVGGISGKKQDIKNRPPAPPESYGASGSSGDEVFFGAVTSPAPNVYEMKIGPITYQVKSGDITKEKKTDIIVNSSNQDFTRYSGVSKVILDAAGPSVVSLAKKRGSRPHTGYVITHSGRMRHCKKILHLTVAKNPESIEKIVLDVLRECKKHQVSSVTFPALGTGAGGLSASTVADSILDGLVDFIKTESVRSLQTVKVVLFQQRMLNDFYTSMKKREGGALPENRSFLTRLSGGDSLKLPSHWKPMGKKLVMEVNVPLGTPEYSAVQKKFQKSCGNRILKILRVQNRDLWLQYQIKKQSMDSKNRSTTNERELFHGTDFASIKHINHNGFNRSYVGKHVPLYGDGTYFALNANYSANDTFSKPGRTGRKHMYLARVLTGLYCPGQKGLKTPPAKNAANPTDLYDSVTDNLQNPSMFVIFNDIQAYPEYHIIFQR